MPLIGIGTLPTLFSPASVPLPPETGGRGHTSLPCGWGVGNLGGVPIPTRGIHCGTLYMYVLSDTNVAAPMTRQATSRIILFNICIPLLIINKIAVS